MGCRGIFWVLADGIGTGWSRTLTGIARMLGIFSPHGLPSSVGWPRLVHMEAYGFLTAKKAIPKSKHYSCVSNIPLTGVSYKVKLRCKRWRKRLLFLMGKAIKPYCKGHAQRQRRDLWSFFAIYHKSQWKSKANG